MLVSTAIVGSTVSPDLEPESFAGNEAERLKELAMLIPEGVEADDALEAKYAAADMNTAPWRHSGRMN